MKHLKLDDKASYELLAGLEERLKYLENETTELRRNIGRNEKEEMKITGARPKNAVTEYQKEKLVVNWLERHNFKILDQGGRSAADIIARNNGKYWFIQVKYTRSTEMDDNRFDNEITPLIEMANK